ncbi:MAG: trypsin-like peptidase domain-containing protein [Chloroflexota bacterium]
MRPRSVRWLVWLGLLTAAAVALSGCGSVAGALRTGLVRRATALARPEPTALAATVTPVATSVPPPIAPVIAIDPAALTDEQLARLAALGEELIVRVYEGVSPSVVHITTQGFRRGFYGMNPSEGTGSGFILYRDGHIVTNHHVIADAQSVQVTLLDQTTVPAEVVGYDQLNDLAVLRVQVAPDAIRPVDLSFTGELKVGQQAIAIGNPFGLDWTLTAGVISSLGRPLQLSEERVIYDVVQPDAAINPGNSGGPLLNIRGQLIGVNTAIRSGAENIGFAIPLSTLRRVVPQLIEKGYYSRPWLGAAGYALVPELARALELPVEQGLMLVRVYDGGPAAVAGLRGADRQAVLWRNVRVPVGGDVLVALDGEPVVSNEALTQYLELRAAMDQAVVAQFYRDGRLLSATIVLSEQPRQ